ncbi:unnamed protein product, partial [Polarella glacialis]
MTDGKLGCFAGSASTPCEFAEEVPADHPLRQLSKTSDASDACYAEPAQTLLFLDWDDTLFPTTELFERWNLPSQNYSARNITHPEGSFASASTMGSLPQKAASKVATVEESEGCQKVEVGVHTKEEREKKEEEEEEEKKKKEKKKEEEEDLSEWWFPDGELTPEQSSLLKDWQSALFQYLTTASRLSSQVVIVTNSRRPWVETCVSTFAPSCKKLFAGSTGGAKGGIKVVYALEVLQDMRSKRKLASNGWEGSFPVKCTMPLSDLEVTEELTWAKFHAFYRRYKGQSWKNIISLGDRIYEHDAMMEMAMRRHAGRGGREQLRVKSLLLPE